MMRFLASFLLACTYCFQYVTANVPSDILASLSASDIADIKAFNGDNMDDAPFGPNDLLAIASQNVYMEHHILRQSSYALFQNRSGTFNTLEYTTWPSETALIIHLTYLKNEERQLKNTGVTVTIGASGSLPADTAVVEVLGTVGTCSYKAFSIQTSTGASLTLDTVQFVVYTNYSGITANNITRNFRPILDKHLSTITASNYPRSVVVGAFLLQSLGTGALPAANVSGIMDIIVGKVCDKLENIPTGICTNGGILQVGPGLPNCLCPSNRFGKICGILCVNGTIKQVPLSDREVCECDFGFGQDGCAAESPVSDFITRARKTALKCQDLLTGHEEYLYKEPNTTQTGVDPLLAGIVHDALLQTQYTVGNSTNTFRFDELTKDPSFHATMDRTNDLLAAIHISRTSPVTGRITIEHTASYATMASVVTERVGSSGKIGFCLYEYRLVQRYKPGVQQAAAKLFFVAGVQDISTMPTNTSLTETPGGSGEKIDTWSVDGTSMKDIIFGFTVIGRDEPGKIPENQLDEVAKCYALEACHSIPIDCGSGTQVESDYGPMCECPGNVTGIQCQLPMC